MVKLPPTEVNHWLEFSSEGGRSTFIVIVTFADLPSQLRKILDEAVQERIQYQRSFMQQPSQPKKATKGKKFTQKPAATKQAKRGSTTKKTTKSTKKVVNRRQPKRR